jgi:splicing suppressor protein 51
MHLLATEKLDPYPTYKLTFTCTTCSSFSAHGTSECELLQVVSGLETFRHEHFNSTQQVSGRIPTETPRSTYKALSSASTWVEYFTEISDKKQVLASMPFLTPEFTLDYKFLRASGMTTGELQNSKDAFFYLLSGTEELAMPLTILAALEDSFPDLTSRKELLLHFVGARGIELGAAALFEEIMHLVPSLRTIKIVMVGPSSKPESPAQNGKEVELGCCEGCTDKGGRRTIALHGGFYHDFAQAGHYKKPDMAVLFHSGRSQAEEESWAPTTRFLVNSETLTLCTTFTEREAHEECEELDELGAKFIKRVEENRWRSQCPLPEFLSGPEGAMYYCHYYRYIFQGRK